CGDSYTADYTAIKVIDGMDKNLTTKTIVQGLTVVPEGLNEKYSSADELISDLTGRITLGTEYTVDNAAVYDVVLQYQINDGEWTNATVDNYPETGITVTLPYPEGTDRSYEFTVLHMFTETSSRLNITAGEIEMPTVTKTGGGLVFTLNGLSPVAVAWKEAETEAETEKEPAPAISPSGTWKHGLVLDTDGVFRYYQNNAFAKDYVGVVPYDGGLFFIKKRSD
ncbi:MAG: hypothetical protein LUD16_08880, partial [Lachnospiraceae bacterium]|nr:hypothetical protein [Lachnospiraceae bacterium]